METLTFSPSPHIRTGRTVTTTMLHVIVALLPATVTALYFFGLDAAGVLAVSIAVCVAAEWAIDRFLLKRKPTLGDLSAVVTGLLLGLNLPAGLPWWTVALGAVFAIGVGKMTFGGLGSNIFNPALAGRVFLLISFPVLMTTWPLPGDGFTADGSTGPTVLSILKEGGNVLPATADLVTGHMGGAAGETGAAAILIGCIYLLAMRVITWHIPAAIIATAALMCVVTGAPVAENLLSGGLLLGAVFMATDYVTSPVTYRGMLVYGVLIGAVTMIIRLWGAYPEGVSFAILLGNGLTPLINLGTRPRRFGERSAR